MPIKFSQPGQACLAQNSMAQRQLKGSSEATWTKSPEWNEITKTRPGCCILFLNFGLLWRLISQGKPAV